LHIDGRGFFEVAAGQTSPLKSGVISYWLEKAGEVAANPIARNRE
jgi:hypothetical protein